MNLNDYTKDKPDYEIDGDVEEDTPKDGSEPQVAQREYDV